MPFENRILTFSEWFLGDSSKFQSLNPNTWDQLGFMWGSVAVLFLLSIIAPFIWYLMAVVQHGPSEGFYLVASSIYGAFTDDLPRFSFRRTFAVMRLAIQEAIRNKILIGFSVFLLVLLFAGLFLDISTNENPARVYLNFVLSITNFLVLMMALFLSVFSIPNDIENRTIYTVVTKPVRAGEIVLGRVLGFVSVGTVMLACMCAVSYVFVVRGLSHTHTVDMATLRSDTSVKNGPARRVGETSFNQKHMHAVIVTEQDGKITATTDTKHGHRHAVKVQGSGDDAKLIIGPSEGNLIARAPQFGLLQVYDRDGNLGTGTNVGNEWTYRGYIEGGKTKAVAIWTFKNITKKRFPNGIPLELNLSVFRTYKGDIERGVLGEIVVRRPADSKGGTASIISSPPRIFESQEYVSQRIDIPTSWETPPGADGKKGTVSLFDDLVDDEGNLEVRIRCAEGAQYFGVAQADVYIRARDNSFAMNFLKGYLSIWLQLLLVTCFGVTFSTFLKGPVAMLATMAAIVLGFFVETIRGVSTGTSEGGGPIESLIRILTQQNVMTDVEVNSTVMKVVKVFDSIMMAIMHSLTFILPNYRVFDTSNFVSSGYDIYGALVAQHVMMAFVYFFAVTLVGYFFLKTREIAG